MDNKTEKNKTYIIKTNFWARARLLVPIEAANEEEAKETFLKGAENFFQAEIKEIEIEQISDNPDDFTQDLMPEEFEDEDIDDTETKSVH